MKLYEKVLKQCSIYFNSDSTIQVVDEYGILTEIINKENIMETLVTMLLDRSLAVEGSDLVEICDNVIELMDSISTEATPCIEVDNGILLYVNGSIIFRNKEDIYNSRRICSVTYDSENNMNETTIKLLLVKNKVDICEKSFSYFIKAIKNYTEVETVIKVSKDNMHEYIKRVPDNVMCTFLNEYFNRR